MRKLLRLSMWKHFTDTSMRLHKRMNIIIAYTATRAVISKQKYNDKVEHSHSNIASNVSLCLRRINIFSRLFISWRSSERRSSVEKRSSPRQTPWSLNDHWKFRNWSIHLFTLDNVYNYTWLDVKSRSSIICVILYEYSSTIPVDADISSL